MKLTIFGDYHYVSDNMYDHINKYLNYSEEYRRLKNKFHKVAIKSIFEEESDYYISVGDLTNYGKLDEIEGVFSLISDTEKKEKFIHVPGNHDLYTFSIEDLLLKTEQKVNYCLENDLVKLIFINSARSMDYEEWAGYLSIDVAKWLETELIISGEKPVIVFAHHPIYDTTAMTNYPHNYIECDINLKEILEKKDGKGIFVAGHTHRESIKTRDNWTFISLDSFIDHPKVLTVEISKEEIDVKSKDLLIGIYEEERQIIAEHMPHYTFNLYGQGTQYDKEIKIFL